MPITKERLVFKRLSEHPYDSGIVSEGQLEDLAHATYSTATPTVLSDEWLYLTSD